MLPPLVVACLVVFFEGFSFGAIFPVIGYFTVSLGGTETIAGLLLASVSLPKVFTNPFFGRLSDRVGRRPVLVVNTLGTLLGSVAWALSNHLAWLAVSRLITGVFSAQAGIVQAIAADTTPPPRRAAAMGLLGASFGVAICLGPLVGGWVGRHYSYAAVGWFTAALQFVSLLSIVFVLRETSPQAVLRETHPKAAQVRPESQISNLKSAVADQSQISNLKSSSADLSAFNPVSSRDLLARLRIRELLLIILLGTIAQSHLIVATPFLAKDAYAFDAELAGRWFGVMGVVAILVQGGLIRPIVRRLGERRTTFIGTAVLAGGFALTATQPSPPLFWTAAAILGLGLALSTPCLSALLSRSAGEHEQGAVSGLYQATLGFGRGIGHIAGGALYQLAAGAPFWVGSALCAAALALLGILRNRNEVAVSDRIH